MFEVRKILYSDFVDDYAMGMCCVEEEMPSCFSSPIFGVAEIVHSVLENNIWNHLVLDQAFLSFALAAVPIEVLASSVEPPKYQEGTGCVNVPDRKKLRHRQAVFQHCVPLQRLIRTLQRLLIWRDAQIRRSGDCPRIPRPHAVLRGEPGLKRLGDFEGLHPFFRHQRHEHLR